MSFAHRSMSAAWGVILLGLVACSRSGHPEVPTVPSATAQCANSTAFGSSADAWYDRAAQALADGSYREASFMFNCCLEADKTYSICYRGMGLTARAEHNAPRAAKYLRAYLAHSPDAADKDEVTLMLTKLNAVASD